MSFLWPSVILFCALVIAAATELGSLSSAVALAVLVPLAVGILLKNHLEGVLFPKRTYGRRCLSIHGLEQYSEVESYVRRELSNAVFHLFSGPRPSGCCCFQVARGRSEVTLVLHLPRGQCALSASGSHPKAAVRRLVRAMEGGGKRLEFVPSLAVLPVSCRRCPTRKAHTGTQRAWSELVPDTRRKRAWFRARWQSLRH